MENCWRRFKSIATAPSVPPRPVTYLMLVFRSNSSTPVLSQNLTVIAVAVPSTFGLDWISVLCGTLDNSSHLLGRTVAYEQGI